MYVDYDFYAGEYGGMMDPDSFGRQERTAEAYVRYFLFSNAGKWIRIRSGPSRWLFALFRTYWMNIIPLRQPEPHRAVLVQPSRARIMTDIPCPMR